METKIYKEDKVLTCINCITGKIEELIFESDKLMSISETESSGNTISFIGPGLIDLQINGINGIDFNNPSLTREDIVKATYYLLSKGITTFLPTVITNSDKNILEIVRTIYMACISDTIVNDCIWGIHLEGPFISPEAGAKGAHDEKYIKPPDWKLLKKFQEAAGGKIKLITIAPEWEGSRSFIEKCKDHGILVSIGHSMANSEQISMAVKAGASLSTHLGNGVPLLLPRHPNIIWDQLAAKELYACIITDGIHIPDSFIKVVIKNKAKTTIVVSDATCFAGMHPGEYQNHIGGTVIVDKEKRVSLKSFPGLLAGAAKTLVENVEYLIHNNLSTLSEGWQMASVNASKMLAKKDDFFNNDKVIFQLNGEEIQIEKVIKSGRVVFEK
ncbi:MAG: amidohydrolase family protein [Chitinophagaceae bacterium]|nr:amidohydrolase family protein [Chitinophagaceae bacterium]